jgi:hypothetical protein
VTGIFEVATRATTRSPPTAIVHLRLPSFPHTLPFKVTQEVLSEYFPKGNLTILDMPFNLINAQKEAAWEIEVQKVIANLFGCSNVVFFVTTHSDPDTGDLWLGEEKPGKPFAALASDVSAC